MKQLLALIDTDDKRKAVIADCATLIDSEVRGKKGLGGLAVKTAYKVVKALKPGMIEDALDALVDEFIGALDGYYKKYQEAGSSGTLSGYLSARKGDVAESLLAITDGKARGAKSKTVANAYNKLRPKGKAHVEDAVPGMGQMLDRNVATL